MSFLFFQLKVAALLLILYGIFKIIISNSNQFKYKRAYLLFSLAIAFIAPFLTINIQKPGLLNYYQSLPEVVVRIYSTAGAKEWDYMFLIILMFGMVSALFLAISIYQLFRLFRLTKTLTRVPKKGFILVEAEGNKAYSFFKIIFIGKEIPVQNREVIIEHEMVHVKSLHSIDNVLIDLVLIIQWFNPVAWLMRKEIRENHEYEADETLLKHGVSVENYQELLLNQMFQTSGVRFSSFNYNSFIKNRIKMMTKTNAAAGKTRFLLAAIMCLLVVSVFSFKAEIKSLSNNSAVAIKDTIKAPVSNDEAFLVVEQSATFQGKDLMEFNNYVMKNIIYPQDAVKNKWQGKVFVQFIVEKDGTIKETKVLRSSNFEILDNEALRVVRNAPVWEPAKQSGKIVRQEFTLPVVFKLN